MNRTRPGTEKKMKTWNLKSKTLAGWTLASLVAMTPILAHARGGESGGGGDPCENRIQSIRDDIGDWILKGGQRGLELPSTVTADTYARKMSGAIQAARVACVKPGDQDYPIQVNGTAKVCRFDAGRSLILCDYNTFMDSTRTSESDQYVLIHHEFAGLAGIENPNGDVSTYTVSKQISGFLVDTIVKKLAVGTATHTGNQRTPCLKPVPTVAELFRIVSDPAQGVPQIEKYLSENPVSLGAKNEFCRTPAQAAIVARKIEVYKYLYRRSGSPDVNQGWSDLFYYGPYLGTSLYQTALEYGDLALVQQVRSQGGKVPYGTELMWAAVANDPSVVRALLSQPGASLEARDTGGHTALMYAAIAGRVDTIKYLISLGADVNAHALTNEYSHPRVLKGPTPLIYAAATNTEAAVEVLLNAGADVNAKEADVEDTALHRAIRNVHYMNIVKLLIEAGADVNATNLAGQTILFNSTDGGEPDKEIILFLLHAGADPNISEDGWTPLMNLAYTKGVSVGLIKAMIEAGARKDATCRENTAYSLAKEQGQSQEILDLLKP